MKKSVTAVVFLLVFLGFIFLIVLERYPLDVYAISLAAVSATIIDFVMALLVRATGSSRISLALSGKRYIVGKFVHDNYDIEEKNIPLDQIEMVGQVRTWKMNKEDTYQIPDRLYHASTTPVGYWKYKNPKPIELYPHEVDEKLRTTSQLTEAINAKFVSDLHKSIYTKVEMIFLIVALATVGISILNLYLINQVATQFNTLIEQLGRIVGSLPK